MNEKKYTRKPDIIAADMDGEVVMMDIVSGKYYNLGRTGGAIWNLLESPKTLDELVDILTAKYDVDRATCKAQVEAFLKTGLEHGLFSME
ncbi:MAG: lasso peptide biosynthesis PqqD family chaperone [Lachnospiraceae bacterium]|nr:lasso peptide biosynthesis PqqD family chaperone [Lachnospiraceae bacterium]